MEAIPVIRMARVVSGADLPNEARLPPAEFVFPVLLDFTGSLVDSAAVLALLGVVRRARAEKGTLRLRLAAESQVYDSLHTKGFDRGLFRQMGSGAVQEWELRHDQ